MKIYKDKDGNLTIVFDKNTKSDDCNVTLIHDRGAKKQTNMFGQPISRYIWRVASAYGDSGYYTATNDVTKAELGKEYKLLLKKRGK